MTTVEIATAWQRSKERLAEFGRRTRVTRRRLAVILAVVGPGIITSNVDNDAGGITTYTIAGAQFGYALLWTLIPLTIALYVSEEMCARMGVVTGKGLSDLIREEFGFRSTFFVMLAALAVDLGNTVAEFAGVAAASEIFHVSKYISVPIAAVIVWLLVVRGSYRQVEKIFLVACAFYFSYVLSAFLAKPDWLLAAEQTVVPTFSVQRDYLLMLVWSGRPSRRGNFFICKRVSSRSASAQSTTSTRASTCSWAASPAWPSSSSSSSPPAQRCMFTASPTSPTRRKRPSLWRL